MPVVAVVLILILLFIIFLLRTPMGRGRIGEFKVKMIIGKSKKGYRYVINDLRIRSYDGKTSQIDHVVIQANGVFVIETKNYSGRIYGNDQQVEWTQVLQYGKVKNKFYNPIKQNKTHIYRMNQILDVQVPIFSAVVFVQGNTKFISAQGVYTLFELKHLISQPTTSLISVDQMEHIYSVLTQAKKESNLSTAEHISNIRNMHKNIQNLICPRCGGTLLIRTHNNSSFYGCSNYPKCLFTKRM